MTATLYLWLSDVLPAVQPDYECYGEHERNVLTPALEAAGYVVQGAWFTGDGDSFGPLTRCVRTDKGTVVYG